jgi:TPR repeat protein
MTHAALNGMDAKDWAGVRDRLVAALAVDGQFVPAVLLIRALRFARPSVFKQGDITDDEAKRRIEGASTEAKEHGKRFVELLASSTSPSQPSSTSGSRMLLMGCWNDWIEMDHDEAVKWYRKAAEQGDANAQFILGARFMQGQGAKDSVEAVKWWREAAEQGNASTQFVIHEAPSEVEGVAKDPVEAVKWYRKAAEQGHTYAREQVERLTGRPFTKSR